MNYEVEQKFRVNDSVQLREQLEAAGAQFSDAKRQVDRYFAHPARNFAETDEAFRLRQDGETNRITYKGPKLDGEAKTRREIELPLPSIENYLEDFTKLLESLGFQVVAEVAKTRTPGSIAWQDRQLEIALDEVSEVGSFVELELISDSAELSACQQTIAALAAKLGLKESIRISYLEMLLAARQE